MSTHQLKDFLHHEAQKLSDKAHQKRGMISENEVEHLERLARIVEIYQNTGPTSKPKRRPTVIILSITLLIVAGLFSLKRSRTEIELDLTLTELRFVLSQQVPLTNAMVVSSLGISELKDIQLPRTRGQNAQQIDTTNGIGTALHLSKLNNDDLQSTITLNALMLPAGTLVRIAETDVSNQYRLFLEMPKDAPPITIQVSVKGTIQLAPSGEPARQYDFPVPRSIRMQPATNQLTFDLTLPEKARPVFASHLPAEDLKFTKVEEFIDTQNTYIREISTIVSGTLYLAELNNREYPLRNGEGLQFDEPSGPIRILTLKDNQIALQFHGDVRGMTLGWDGNRKSLMPRLLEWIYTQHSLTLLWGAIFSVFGFALTLFQWWRKTQ